MVYKIARGQHPLLNESNHIASVTSLDGLEVYNIYKSAGVLNTWTPQYNPTVKVTAEVTPKNVIVVFYDDNENIVAWENYEDFAVKVQTILEYGIANFSYGYITGTHHPFGIHSMKGLQTASSHNGYHIWISNN